MSIEARLQTILKRYDRIGFGRRGVLDAEHEIRRLAAELPAEDGDRLRRIVASWADAGEAQRIAARLHYNLPENVQALAIRLRRDAAPDG